MRCFWWPVLQQFDKSLIVVNCVASQSFVALELTNVTSHDYVININDPWKPSDFIGHPPPKDYFPNPHIGPPTTPGPPTIKIRRCVCYLVSLLIALFILLHIDLIRQPVSLYCVFPPGFTWPFPWHTEKGVFLTLRQLKLFRDHQFNKSTDIVLRLCPLNPKFSEAGQNSEELC